MRNAPQCPNPLGVNGNITATLDGDFAVRCAAIDAACPITARQQKHGMNGMNHSVDSGHTPTCPVVEQRITPRDRDLGGFSVRRSLPVVGRKSIGPWVFFDHFGLVTLATRASGTNVRPHPHVNLARVSTFLPVKSCTGIHSAICN